MAHDPLPPDELIPALRSGVSRTPRAADDRFPSVLVDPVLGQRVKLDPTGDVLVQVLDQPQTPAEAMARSGLDAAPLQQALGFLRRLHLLDTAEASAFVEAAEHVRSWQEANTDEVPLLFRDDARFTCTQCGSCCGGHNVGPVSDETLSGLSGAMEDLAVKAGTRDLFFRLPVRVGDEMREQTVCHTRGGSCVFLADDRRCLIHAHYGGEKKPVVCQTFPWQFIATPEGIAVSLQMECRGFVEARRGKRLRDQEAEVRQLLRRAPLKRVRPVLMLDSTTALPWSDYMALETALHAVVDRHATHPMAALLAMRDEIAKGQRRQEPSAEIDSDGLAQELDTLLTSFGESLGMLHQFFARSDDTVVVHVEGLEELAAAARILRPEMRRVVHPLGRKDQQELFVEMVHHHLMNKELTLPHTLTLGFARLTFGWFLAKGLMIHRARQMKRRHLVAQDVMDSIVLVHFLFRNHDLLSAIKRHDAAIVDLFYHRLPALLDASNSLPAPDRRAELYKF